MNAASLHYSKARWLLVGFDGALLGLGIVLCFSGVEAGALLAVLGAFFLALATWSDWPSVMRRVVCWFLALAWFSTAIWFCLSLGRRTEVLEGAIGGDTWRGWPFRYGLASHCSPEPSMWRPDQFSVPAFVGDVLVGAVIGLVPVLLARLTLGRKRTRPVTPKAARSDTE